MERQRAEVRDGVAGADARLAAAFGLQKRLEAILEGEAPLDIYVEADRYAEAMEVLNAAVPSEAELERLSQEAVREEQPPEQ